MTIGGGLVMGTETNRQSLRDLAVLLLPNEVLQLCESIN